MDIQVVFNEYKAVVDMCQYFPKADGRCSYAMKQVATETFKNNMNHHDTIQSTAKNYSSNQECSIQ